MRRLSLEILKSIFINFPIFFCTRYIICKASFCFEKETNEKNVSNRKTYKSMLFPLFICLNKIIKEKDRQKLMGYFQNSDNFWIFLKIYNIL